MPQRRSQLAEPEPPVAPKQQKSDEQEIIEAPFALPVDNDEFEVTAGSTSDIIRVLVVQEDAEAFHELRHLLPPTHSCDFDFQQATSWAKAKAQIDKSAWDVIFVDIEKISGGLDFAMNKVVEIAGSHPVIVLTPMQYEHIAHKAIRKGAQDYIIQQETQPQLLHRTIWAAIDRFNLNNALQAKTRQLERAFWQKHQFLSTLSHEIKTPMNGIRGGMQLLREDAQDEEQIESIEMIDTAIDQLMLLIDNLLEHGKAESGKIIIHHQPTPLEHLINALDCTFQMACEVKGLNLEIKIADGTPHIINIDALRLRQVLSNLIGNAIKFTDTGSVTVMIEQANADNLHFSVTDTGRGIPEGKLDTIFQPYDQGGDCSETGYKGTGLGLTICKDYTEAMGGKIYVKSTPGVGSTFGFSVKLPS